MAAKLRPPSLEPLKLSVYLEPDLVADVRRIMHYSGLTQADTVRLALRELAKLVGSNSPVTKEDT